MIIKKKHFFVKGESTKYLSFYRGSPEERPKGDPEKKNQGLWPIGR